LTIDELLATLAGDTSCLIYPPRGELRLDHECVLPDDVRRFYQLCGGVDLFPEREYPAFVLPPNEVARANPVIVGQRVEGDRSDAWYLIAHDGNGDYLTLDCSPERAGRCYDSFHETHGLAGQTPVIARSFTELLTRCYEAGGRYPYWLRADFTPLGDAYDA
jgi:antitoxin YokJ